MTKTVYNTINHIYYILLISGFVTFIYNDKTKTFKPLRLVYHMGIVFSVIAFPLLFYILNCSGIVYEENQLLNVLSIFYNNSLLFKVYSAAICARLYYSDFLESWKALLTFDEEMRKFGIKLPYTQIKYIPHLVILPQLIFKWTIQIIITIDFNNYYGTFSYMLYTMYLSTDFIITTIRQFYVTLGILFAYYYIELDKIVNRTKDTKFLFGVNKSSAVNFACKFHLELSHISRNFTKVFSPIVIALFADSFYLSTVHLYNIISKLYNSNNTKHWMMTAQYSAFWILESACTIGTFVIPAGYCLKSAQRMKSTLRKVSSTIGDEDVLRNIRHFSLQLLHEELEMTAGGFFVIDYSAIFNIVGAVATHCFILIQFDMASKKEHL